jgi:hypothetical protein
MHRAETILNAIETALTGLTTTGANVERGRVYSVDITPSLSIEMGNDEAILTNFSKQDRALDVVITSYTKSTANTETQSNAIRAEVYAALMNDRTLGLSFVSNIFLENDLSPQLSGEGGERISTQALNYIVNYRHSLTNAEG